MKQKKSKSEAKEIQEVKNAYAAYERLSEIDPYNIQYLKQFHGIMTKYLIEESGDFRSDEEGVFNGDQCIFMAPPAQLVPQLMDERCTKRCSPIDFKQRISL